MDPQQIRDALRRQPFVPFRLLLEDGTAMEVQYPDRAFVTRRTVYVANAPEGQIADRAVPIPVEQVTGIEAPPTEGWWPYMQRVRAEREARGYHFMDEPEMQAHVLWVHDDEERMDQVYREVELEKRRRADAGLHG